MPNLPSLLTLLGDIMVNMLSSSSHVPGLELQTDMSEKIHTRTKNVVVMY